MEVSLLSEMCVTCAAANSCPYFGQDGYYWNGRGDDRCSEILEKLVDKSKREFMEAWYIYANEYAD